MQGSDAFYRAIPANHLREDGTVSPGAFARASSNNKLSVDWADLSSPEETYARWERRGAGRGVASITAQLCWDNSQFIEFDPTPDNPSHSEITDQPGTRVGNDRLRKNLSRQARLIISREGP